MRVLIIGHGYLGAEIARQFRAAGWEVMSFSKSGDEDALPCDVSNPAGVASLPAADCMIHCAASGRGGAEAYQRVYVDGCRNLVRSQPQAMVIFTSSSSVYAQTDGSVVTESSPTEPDRETGKLLLEAEQTVLDARGIVARLSGIYGPGRSVILKKFLTGDARIEEDGRRYLNQIHRDDAARAILHLAETRLRGEIFNVSDSQPLRQIDCYRHLAEWLNRTMPPIAPRDLNRKRGWTHKQVSNAKLLKTGWKPQYPCYIDALASILPTISAGSPPKGPK
ncbi:MAG: NAD-dependent epimerase/dehydratase family protein [Luteolibacter sp.]